MSKKKSKAVRPSKLAVEYVDGFIGQLIAAREHLGVEVTHEILIGMLQFSAYALAHDALMLSKDAREFKINLAAVRGSLAGTLEHGIDEGAERALERLADAYEEAQPKKKVTKKKARAKK